MKRFIMVIAAVSLVAALGLDAQTRGGSTGDGPRGGGGTMAGPQHHPDPHHRQVQQQQQSQVEECEHWCLKAREEAKHLERYCDRSSFESATARQLGRQLAERLEAMERQHARLQEQFSQAEPKRLRAMEESQQRWREAFAELERELEKEEPSRAALRRHARTIHKELGKFQKEMHALESASSD